MQKNEKIANLNDMFRKGFYSGMRTMTRGVSQLPEADLTALFTKVSQFDAFNEDNDPYGEHDFGKIEHNGEAYFWKIDYYAADTGYMYGSEDASDMGKTDRVLTVMYANEY